ncbi:porin [Pelagibacteraceae bacterium]|jgi:outer membrane protein OmpU|nr:porin [Pelagibacteraceae bacterium]
MNKLSKLGVSALCGSLAAISAANAGDLTATGGATVTWLSEEGATTGNPIGMTSAVSFIGEGELDNGWGVKLTIAGNDAGAYSASNVKITLPGMGDVIINQGDSGTGIARMDDMTPSVYEEADGAGISAGIDKTVGVNGGTTIEVTPTEYMPAGLTARFAYSKDADGGNVNDKSAGGVTGALGSGWDITLEAGSDLTGVDGLTLWAGMSEYEQFQNAATVDGDGSERTYGIKYATGAFTVGFQMSDEETGETAITDYENTMYSVTFNVNDDLSIGYNHIESDQVTSGDHGDAEATSYQASYTMGGATFAISEVDIENRAYGTAATADVSGTVVSMALAF